MMQTELTTDTKPALLTIAGDMTFASVNELRNTMLAACDAADELVVSLDKLTGLDAAGLQLLFSLCRYASQSNKKVSIRPGAAAERLDRILEFTGLTPPNCLSGDTPA